MNWFYLVAWISGCGDYPCIGCFGAILIGDVFELVSSIVRLGIATSSFAYLFYKLNLDFTWLDSCKEWFALA